MTEEKQIEEIFKIVGSCVEVPDRECDKYGTCAHCKAVRIYNAGNRKQEWISVEDRLPGRNGRYLTHCNIEGQSLVCILYYCKVGVFNEGTVTHWMPLPEAPQMKGDAK